MELLLPKSGPILALCILTLTSGFTLGIPPARKYYLFPWKQYNRSNHLFTTDEDTYENKLEEPFLKHPMLSFSKSHPYGRDFFGDNIHRNQWQLANTLVERNNILKQKQRKLLQLLYRLLSNVRQPETEMKRNGCGPIFGCETD